jgi:hypothetical protein
MHRPLVYALALAGSVTSVLASDLLLDPVPAPQASSIAGYVEASIRGDADSYESIDFGKETRTQLHLEGAARVAIPVAPNLSLQLDGWAARVTERYDDCEGNCEYSYERIGGAAHLAYVLGDGATVGALISVGAPYLHQELVWATGALEGAVTFDNLRLHGQAGISSLVHHDPGYSETFNVFAQGVLAYYIDANLKVSVAAGVSQESWDDGDETVLALNWGAKVEKKLDDSPISLFAAYEGWYWEQGDSVWREDSHAIKFGARFAFGNGTSTLQDLDNTVGLKDMNHVYGQQN